MDVDWNVNRGNHNVDWNVNRRNHKTCKRLTQCVANPTLTNGVENHAFQTNSGSGWLTAILLGNGRVISLVSQK